MANLTVTETEEALAAAAAERVTRLVEDAIARADSAVVCLTGGRTPRRLYELLADERHPWRARIEWPRVHLFWGDERHVPPDHPDSNFGMARRALVAHVPIPPAHVHRMQGEAANAADAAREYERTLRDGFCAAGRADRTFDVVLLGLGEDAHIASIFPGSPILAADNGDAAAIWAEHLRAWRITLTPRALLDAHRIVVLVAGDEKAHAVRAALALPEDVSRWPAQLLRGADDRVEWILDRAAAAHL